MQHPWDKGALRNSRLRLRRKRSRRQNLKTLEGNVGRAHHTLQLDRGALTASPPVSTTLPLPIVNGRAAGVSLDRGLTTRVLLRCGLRASASGPRKLCARFLILFFLMTGM